MKNRVYEDFDLLIERNGAHFRARVLSSPDGTATGEFKLPSGTNEQIEILNEFDQIQRTWQQTGRIESRELREVGERLFHTIFSGPVSDRLRSSLAILAQKPDIGLRIRLRLSEVPELIGLPWEYMYDGGNGRFLSLSTSTPVVRYLDMPGQIIPLAVPPPLHILAMIANPVDYARVDVEREWLKLRDAVADLERNGLVVLHRIERPTLAALQRWLRKETVHIFHFIGHGGFDESSQDGLVMLETEEGKARPTSGRHLGMLLHDEKSIRLVVLGACDGAVTSHRDPFAGVGQSLIRQGIPAVVAMQAKISDDAAIGLAHEFYAALADSFPVEAALTEARKAIAARDNNLDWGTPVLYLRAQDGQLFRMSEVLGETQGTATTTGNETQPETPDPRAASSYQTQTDSALPQDAQERLSVEQMERTWHQIGIERHIFLQVNFSLESANIASIWADSGSPKLQSPTCSTRLLSTQPVTEARSTGSMARYPPARNITRLSR